MQTDLGTPRQFRLAEAVSLRLRAEFFYVLNHPNFGNPNGDLTSTQFGRSMQALASSLGSSGANGGFNPLYQIGGPRSIQAALEALILITEQNTVCSQLSTFTKFAHQSTSE